MMAAAYSAGVRGALIKLSLDVDSLNPLSWAEHAHDKAPPELKPLISAGAEALHSALHESPELNKPVPRPENLISPDGL